MRIVILLFTLFTFFNQGNAACPVGNLTLSTQTEINNFATTYIDCTAISGTLTIEGSTTAEILNLDGLSPLLNISEDLIIINNQDLTSISGLANISSVGGDLIIENVSDLTSLSPLSNLNTIIGDLTLKNVNTITNLVGLENLTSIDGKMTLFGLNAVTTLSALSNLNSIGEGVSINFMLSLTDLTGLEGIAGLSNLELVSNTSLINLTGLNNLINLSGFLKISSNNNLTSLIGLEGLNSVGFYLQILSNPKLTSLSGLDNINTINGQFWLGSNATLNSLAGLSSLTTINNQFNCTNNSAIINFNGLESLLTVNGQLEITGNAALNSLTGLDNITSINGDLNVIGNTMLSDCAVLGICTKLELNPADVNFAANATGCSSNAQVIDVCQSLPVELSSFNLSTDEGITELTWSTASEYDNKGFNIEHSTDGNNFKMVGYVPGNGYSERINYYNFFHDNPIKGINYYRLKQMDYSDEFEYSYTLSVHNYFEDLSIFPNPTSGDIRISGYVPEQFDIRISKIGGELVENIEGHQSKIISMAGYETGIYVVQVFTSKRPTVFRVVKR